MCWFINSEVLLTNLLEEQRDGVTYEDIENYCGQIAAVLKEKQPAQSVLFDLSAASFSEDLARYPHAFRFSAGKFRQGLDFETVKRQFQRNIDKDRQEILNAAVKRPREPAFA